ncbi:MAG: hypothetical protein FWE87_06295 [Coriobacteriia bacterium]|nr:hypothetical protein [Coriobacteriia bacterium]
MDKKLWYIVIAALLVLALAIGAIWFFGGRDDVEEHIDAPAIEQTEQTQSTTIESNPVETYVEEEEAPVE